MVVVKLGVRVGTDRGCVFGEGDGLVEEVLCDIRGGGDGEADQTSDPSGEFRDVDALEPPGYVDDLLGEMSTSRLHGLLAAYLQCCNLGYLMSACPLLADRDNYPLSTGASEHSIVSARRPKSSGSSHV